jgi:N-methylhydantoinase B/oxoprolinase/acetone carboxylase alpha subunit
MRAGGSEERLPGKTTVEVAPGDRLLVLTPGGGGWG